ncbi:MAG TPA: hypothetical protein VNR62_02335 [Cellulomonas sp.]|nr:hypothetical protein [Cellulomonas sp.]
MSEPARRPARRPPLVVLVATVAAAALVLLVWTEVRAAVRDDAEAAAEPAPTQTATPAVEVAPGVFAAQGFIDSGGEVDLGTVGPVALRLRAEYLPGDDTYRITPLGVAAPLTHVVPLLSDDQGESRQIGAATIDAADGPALLELADVPAMLGFDARAWLWVDRDSEGGGTLVRVPSFPIPSTSEARDSAGFSMMYLYVATAASGLDPDDVTVVFDLPDGTVRAQDCAPHESAEQCEKTLRSPGFFDDFRAAQARWDDVNG